MTTALPLPGALVPAEKRRIDPIQSVQRELLATSLLDLSTFYISSQSGLESRTKLNDAAYAFPFLVDFRPVRYLTPHERSYLDAIVMSFRFLQMSQPTLRPSKKFTPEFDTIATMIAELLSAMARTNMDPMKVGNMNLKDLSFVSQVEVQEDLFYLLFGDQGKADLRRMEPISKRYQLPTETRWREYHARLQTIHKQLSDEMRSYLRLPTFWPIDPLDSVGILESRILAMVAHIMINRRHMIPTLSWMRQLRPYEDLMMTELKVLLETYTRPSSSTTPRVST